VVGYHLDLLYCSQLLVFQKEAQSCAVKHVRVSVLLSVRPDFGINSLFVNEVPGDHFTYVPYNLLPLW